MILMILLLDCFTYCMLYFIYSCMIHVMHDDFTCSLYLDVDYLLKMNDFFIIVNLTLVDYQSVEDLLSFKCY